MNKELLAEVAKMKDNKERLMGKLLNKTYRYMSDLAGDYLKSIGYENFRVGHIVALVNIEVEGTSIKTLAACAGMTKQGMSKLVKELQEQGFVLVEKDPSDARALIVKYTEKGLQAMVDWRKCRNYIDQKFGAVLGENKLETLKDLLSELLHEYENNYAISSKNPLNHIILQAK